ncbi:MAG: heparinase II/III family protein [Armatimonadetes bacterium]|nr:heparinase II/III family protein [Armatimonadota bacterium]
MSIVTAASAKQSATYYTPERVAIGRTNVARYPWAKTLQDWMTSKSASSVDYYIGEGYAAGGAYAAKSDEFMWTLQPSTLIPRVYPHEARAICPVHGTDVRKINAWCAWNIEPVSHPYKVQCKLGKEWYPSNDFLAGDMTSGEFPDDGNGCEYKGKSYYFLRDYVHIAYGGAVIPALRALSQAYVLTGDRTYAHKGSILLARLASEYPNHEDRKDRLFYANTGGRDPHYTWKTGGMITDLIWETFCLEAAVNAYDALYPYLDQDPELLTFLKAKGMPINTADDLRRYIEEKLVRSGMKALLSGDIHGNEGHHQAAALACALVMDDFSDVHPNSKDMVDYAYHGIGHCAYLMINGVTRDGGGHESPGYNRIKCDFIRVNRLMEELRRRHPDQFPTDKYPDLFADQKVRSLFDYYIDIMLMDSFMPSIGDSGNIQRVHRVKPYQYSYLTAENLFAFQRYHDPRYARACTKLDGTLFTGELFEPFPEEEIRAALAKPESQIKRESRLMDGYGIGVLESGEGDNCRAVSLNYTSLIGHRQQDNLSLEMWARGVESLPDIGYPFTWDYRYEWDANLMAHNTVTVDETQPSFGIGGAASLFASANGVHVVSARHDPYPEGFNPEDKCAKGVDEYERMSLLVDVDPERFYVVDLFAVRGGEQHDQSWHGPLVTPQPPALAWETQEGGTLAGKEVAQFAEFTDRWGRTRKDFPCFLTNLRRAKMDQPATWTWNLGLPEGDVVRLHLVPVGGPMEVIMGRGRNPAHDPTFGMDYVLARRLVKPAGRSLFLTVLDAYQKTPVVESVRLLSDSPLVLEVTRSDGKDEITLYLPAGPSRVTSHRPLGVRVRSQTRDKWVRDVQVGEYASGKGPGYATGTIRATNYATNEIALDYLTSLVTDLAPGRAIRIFNAQRTAVFRIRSTRREGARLWITLDQSALLARGPVAEVADGSVTLSAYLVFANGQVDEKGQLKSSLDYFAGSWLGEGKTARLVKGAVRDEKSKVFLADPVAAGKLKKDFESKVVSVWQYGVGDQVEVARMK